ncbi:MAG TPA: alpha/beta hydrolase [Nitrospirota bacterium]|jgi:pimeloyl-ACP methyl ester carboxylesterase
MERREGVLNGGKVCWHEAGEGFPLLLVHGAGATGRVWHRQIGPFSASFRVITPDLPGFGGTDSGSVRAVKDYAGFLSDFMLMLGIPRAHMAGSSMGGWAACWFAVLHPEMVGRLVLISPPGIRRADNPPMGLDGVIKEIEAGYARALSAVNTSVSNPSAELAKAVATMRMLEAEGGLEFNFEGHLREIKAKTLVIWGTEDRLVPVSYADIFKAGIPDSELKLVKGAGHMSFVEKPATVNEMILRFLDGRED